MVARKNPGWGGRSKVDPNRLLEDKMEQDRWPESVARWPPPFLWIKTVADDVILLGCSPSQSNELQPFNCSIDDNLKFVLRDLVLGSLRLK